MAQVTTSASGEQPITKFARFFKAYSLGLSLVIAAVPVGTAYWDLLPLFKGTAALADDLSVSWQKPPK